MADRDAEVAAWFGEAFVEQARARGADWHLRRLDRGSFRAVLDEFERIPRHGRDRHRYMRAVIGDAPDLAGAVCLFLLDPQDWNAAALEAAMRPLPKTRVVRPADEDRPRRKTTRARAGEAAGVGAAGAAGAADDGATDDRTAPPAKAETPADAPFTAVRRRRFQTRRSGRPP